MIRGFIEWYFLTDYSYILENHFYFVNAPDYCFKTFFIQNRLCKQLHQSIVSSVHRSFNLYISYTIALHVIARLVMTQYNMIQHRPIILM